MARNYNKIILVGIIENEPSLRNTINQTSVTNFTLTTSDEWINKNNEKQIYKKWHHIVCWGKVAEHAVNSFKIGDTVLIEGSISYRYYEKNNKKLKVAEIKATNVSKWIGSLNKIILVGNIGGDPELRKTSNSTNVTNFSLSTIDKWYDRKQELQTYKKWHKIVCWNKIAETAVDNIQTGALVLIEGSISYKTYINKDGIKNNHIAEIKTNHLTKWANPKVGE